MSKAESNKEVLATLKMMLERLEDPSIARLWESFEEHQLEMEIYRNVIEKFEKE